jgi:hypothetical protein
MVAELGAAAARTWALTVGLPGTPPRRFEKLPPGREGIAELQWLGFCSTANHPTAWYLDNIELSSY